MSENLIGEQGDLVPAASGVLEDEHGVVAGDGGAGEVGGEIADEVVCAGGGGGGLEGGITVDVGKSGTIWLGFVHPNFGDKAVQVGMHYEMAYELADLLKGAADHARISQSPIDLTAAKG